MPDLLRLRALARTKICQVVACIAEHHKLSDSILNDMEKHFEEICQDVRTQIEECDSRALKAVPVERNGGRPRRKESGSGLKAVAVTLGVKMKSGMRQNPEFFETTLIPYILSVLNQMKPPPLGKYRKNRKIDPPEKRRIIAVCAILEALHLNCPLKKKKKYPATNILDFLQSMKVGRPQVNDWAKKMNVKEVLGGDIVENSNLLSFPEE